MPILYRGQQGKYISVKTGSKYILLALFLEPLRHVPLPRLEPFVNSRVETSSAAECDRQGELRVLASLRVRVCVAALALAASSRARDASGRLYEQLLRHVGVMLARASRPSLLRLVGTEQVCARIC